MTVKKNISLNKTKKELISESPNVVESSTPLESTIVVEKSEVKETTNQLTDENIKKKVRAKAKSTTTATAKKLNETVHKVKNIQEGGDEKKKKVKKEKENKENTIVNSEEELDNGRKLRSFKVKLPDCDSFEGRFTGLTPYQAANKALSKYFRQNKESIAEVVFSINETTRSSKKTIYNYIGKRFKLENPVTYEIKDAKDGTIRKIVKNYKNILKKVKKVDV